jgi:hypothetical protein
VLAGGCRRLPGCTCCGAGCQGAHAVVQAARVHMLWCRLMQGCSNLHVCSNAMTLQALQHLTSCTTPAVPAPHTTHATCRILQKVEAGVYSFTCKGWDQVTEAAKDVINHMLVKDEAKRWGAEQLLEHPWFQVALTAPAAALGLHMVKRLQVFAGMNRCASGPAAVALLPVLVEVLCCACCAAVQGARRCHFVLPASGLRSCH